MTVTVVVALIAALIGTGTGGFLVAWRKDKRQVPIDVESARKAKLEVTQLIEELSTRAVVKAKEQLETQERQAQKDLAAAEKRHGREIDRLHDRIDQLEDIMKAAGIDVPLWDTP